MFQPVMSDEFFAARGRVASLHLHSQQSRGDFQNVDAFKVEAQKGIVGNPRYFARKSRSGGASKRQVTLIEREVVADHAAAFGTEIPPGKVRANIETTGIDLVAFLGKQIQIGEAILFLYEARTPCFQMDAICPGLRERMENKRQGVLAQVIQSGKISVGDEICLASLPSFQES
jgi:MOSC domain-containing protein YiiM